MKRTVSLLFFLIIGFFSCYDGLQDVYEEGRGYKLGDRGPAGGWIFYINPNYKADGWRYLEAAPEDQSTGKFWINSGTSPDPDSTLNGKTSIAIGSGKANTEAIIVQEGHTDSAAKVCRDYRGGGYDDWFLPSKDEMIQMCWNLRGLKYDTEYNPDVANAAGGGVGGFDYSAGVYWSSSEISSSQGMAQFFCSSGMLGYVPKSNTSTKIRAARAF